MTALCAGSMFVHSNVAVAADEERVSVLDEIVVMAQRKSESLQEVPLSIIAIGGDDIKMSGGLSLESINGMIPNVIIEHVSLFPRAASLSMRGVGYAGVESYADPEVAVYINGVYQARNSMALSSALDVAAVEVLRGPQGTLYGRNAFAGAISLRTNRPEMDNMTASASATIGNYGRQDFEIVANIPLSEGKVAGRIAMRLHNFDGYYKNNGIVDELGTIDQTLLGDSYGGESSLYVRPSLRFTPNDEWDITFFGEIYRDRSEATPTVLGPLDGNLLAGLGVAGSNPFGDSRYGDSGDGSDPHVGGFSLANRPANVDTYTLTNETKYTTDSGTFVGIFNYQDTKEEIWTDTDGANINSFTSARWQTYKAYSAELQYITTLGDDLDITSGVFYLHDEYHTTQLSLTDFSAPFVSQFTPFSVDPSYTNNTGKRNSWAAYAQLEYHLTDQLTVVAGARYSYEKKYNVIGEAGKLSAAGLAPTIDFSEHIFSSVPGVVFGPVEQDWDNFSPRLGVNYQANDDVFLFAFWQRAYKSGGYNARSSDRDAFETPFGEEKVDNFEIGMKSEWMDGKLRLNANAFYSKFDGLQRSLVVPSSTSGSGVTTNTTNVADLTSYGLEAEITALIDDTLSVFANIGWNKAYNTSYCADLDGLGATTAPAAGETVCGDIIPVDAMFLVPTDHSDLVPIRAPRWDITAGFNKDFDVEGGVIAWTGRASYRSSFFVNLLNVKYSHRKAILKLDTTLTWTPDSGSYAVSLWGRNLTNEIRSLNYLPVSTLFSAQNPSEPRTYGVTVAVNF